MRLINATTLQLEEYTGDRVPAYAVLSHTWGPQEVTLQDWDNRARAVELVGYGKIRSTCLQAAKDGIEYAWVDTNCIDKTSSAELSEAINSMFAWYRNARACYVYLADVDSPASRDDAFMAAFRKSRWFSRGWTLQELLAPRNVVFFSKDWTVLGTKEELCEQIWAATGIHQEYLENPEAVFSASTARRMSWISNRTTTRVEDLAYCMLGIFNINLALLYGEGYRAFLRLQEEIVKVSDDQSIFCWSYGPSDVPSSWWNILAPHPSAFRDSGDYVPRPQQEKLVPYAMTNVGLSIELPTIHTSAGICAILDVGWDASQQSKSRVTRDPLPGPKQRLCIHLTSADSSGRRCRMGYPLGPLFISVQSDIDRTQLYLRCRGISKDFIPRIPSGTLSNSEQTDPFRSFSRPGDSLFLTFRCNVIFRWALTHDGLASATFDELASAIILPPPAEARRAGIYLGFEVPTGPDDKDPIEVILFIAGFRQGETKSGSRECNESEADQGASKTLWYVEASPPKRKAYNRDSKARQVSIARELDRVEQTARLVAHAQTNLDYNGVHAILHGPTYTKPLATADDTTAGSGVETPLHINIVGKLPPRSQAEVFRFLYGSKEAANEMPEHLYALPARWGVSGGSLSCPDWSHCQQMIEKFKSEPIK